MKARFVSALVAVAMTVMAFTVLPSSAVADEGESVSRVQALVSASMRGSNVAAVVEEADKAAVRIGIENLSKVPAFKELLDALSPDGTLATYYAVTLTASDFEVLARSLEGKHFMLSHVGEQIRLSLEPGESAPVIDSVRGMGGAGRFVGGHIQPDDTYGYKCWQAYVAAFAFALGMGMVCLPAGAWALACSGGSAVLFPINWNKACR